MMNTLYTNINCLEEALDYNNMLVETQKANYMNLLGETENY